MDKLGKIAIPGVSYGKAGQVWPDVYPGQHQPPTYCLEASYPLQNKVVNECTLTLAKGETADAQKMRKLHESWQARHYVAMRRPQEGNQPHLLFSTKKDSRHSFHTK